ncbi:MAG TPA: GtrA family protein [Rubrobacteraceae bacterium]|nr:GtrA family protein [Rubrobacteraceae bacterium]
MSKRDKLKRGGKRFSQFTLVGILNAAVDFGVLNLFLWLAPTRDPWQLAAFNGVALVAANINSYWWNTRWTFRGRAEHDFRQVFLFALQALVNIGISNGLFWALIHPLLTDTDIPAYLVGNVAKLISVIVASTISFFIMRYLVFSRKRWFGGRL